ncbi:MAG: tyrosine--tRNA ligase, partial [Candidatus Acidiferrum sp.]
IGVGESAYDQFAKTMRIPDPLMRQWLELLTDVPTDEITTLTDAAITHPMMAKKRIGRDIVTFYHSDQAAAEAQAEWEKRFSARQDPTEIAEVPVAASELQEGKLGILRLLVALGLATSNNEARRLIQGGGVTIGPDKAKLTDPTAIIAVANGLIVRVGSRRVVRVRVT